MATGPDPQTSRLLRLAAALTALLGVVHAFAADRLGFGDAEALYASYALYPQAAYLDHPGLIGLFARAIGDGAPPSPAAAHRVTTAFAAIVPWLAALAARALGASWRGAALAALALLVTPELAIGLFGMTPDLPLVVCWYASLGCAGAALSSEPGSLRALVGTLAAAGFAALGFDAKVSGGLLLVGLALAFATRFGRPHLRTLAPWAGLALAAVVVSPVVLDEAHRGFPMLRHRLLDAHHGGPSLRNLGALVGGQLLYLTPPILLCALFLFADLVRRRRESESEALLFSTTVATTPLLLLALASRVAEPHWVAPAFLALPLHLALREGDPRPLLPRWATVSSAVIGLAAIALVHAAVLFPFVPRLLGPRYVPRYDLANDLYAWRDGIPFVAQTLAEEASDGPPPIVVGPHWIVCAQLRAGLPRSVLVGCGGDEPADFATWLPRATWSSSPVILYVTDDRFERDPAKDVPDHGIDAVSHIGIRRGGVPVRRITVYRLVRGARATR